MDDQLRIRMLEANLERNLSWIHSADARVNLIFSIDTAMLGVVVAMAGNVAQWETHLAALVVVCLAPTMVSLVLI